MSSSHCKTFISNKVKRLEQIVKSSMMYIAVKTHFLVTGDSEDDVDVEWESDSTEETENGNEPAIKLYRMSHFSV